LYDLVADIGEKNNLADAKPGIARNMYDELVQWRRIVEAQLPEKNPDFIPEK
jgi:hypothetical protein